MTTFTPHPDSARKAVADWQKSKPGRHGVPQVVSRGALDMVNFGPRETVPPRFERRNLYVHNPTVTLMRTTPATDDFQSAASMASGMTSRARRPDSPCFAG